MRRKSVFEGVALGVVLAFASPALAQSQSSDSQGLAASDGPGSAASWTTGNKLAVGASATTDSKVWFTVAKGIVSETFYPRLDVPNMQDMQYVITDGSTFVDLERDATSHAVSMSTEKALEYTGTNTDTRPSARYRITGSVATILTEDARRWWAGADRSCGPVEQVGDIGGLAADIMTVNLSHLSLPHHRHGLETRQRLPRRAETAEAEPRPDKALDTPVVLLDDVVQIFTLSQTSAAP
jgi:hypothetical protein